MKIGQLSQKTGLSNHTIRYYEKMGLLQQPDKDSSGHRIYDQIDLELTNWVTCLKKSGMPLLKIKEYVQAYKDKKEIKLIEILELHLIKLRAQQIDIKHYIQVTGDKLVKLKRA